MITSITMQTQINKNYLNAATVTHQAYGDRFTTDLQEQLNTEIELNKLCLQIVTELNADLNTTNIAAIMERVTGKAPIIKEKTKAKRTYFFAGLTVHEEDKK